MLVVPIVFVSLVAGVSTLGDPARLGRISAMAIGLYLITTGIAVVLALSAALIFQPGAGAAPGSRRAACDLRRPALRGRR